MPTYEYWCKDCNNVWEILDVPVEDREDPCDCPCPYCDGDNVVKPISAPVVKYGDKGKHGWSNNGYADNTLNNDPDYQKNFKGYAGKGVKENYRRDNAKK